MFFEIKEWFIRFFENTLVHHPRALQFFLRCQSFVNFFCILSHIRLDKYCIIEN